MRPTVAVTGATGFIGGHVVRRLRQDGWQLRILTRRPRIDDALDSSAIERVAGGLDDPDSLQRLVRGAAAVVHVAGLIKARTRDAFFRANAEGVGRLAAIAAAQPRPPRFVLLSSLAAREPALSAYAASKRAGELALTTAGGLPWTILRPPAVYGPGDRATLPFFRCVRHGFGPVLGPAGGRLSLVHVGDLAAAVGAVLESERSVGLVAELDDGRPGGYQWPELVRVAAEQLGRPARALRVPKAIPYSLGLLNALLARLPGYTPMLTPGKVRELYHHDWVCDPAPIMDKTAWRPNMRIDQGFASTIAWYRQQRWL